MLQSKKNQLSAGLLAIASVVLSPAAANAATAGDISAAQVLNTSALYADGGSAIACTATNVSTASINVTIAGISASGSVLFVDSYTIGGGQIVGLQTGQGALTGYVRCRFILNYGPGTIRANMMILHANSDGTLQTYAVSEAR
jgi:hypothetical protein